MSEGEGCGITIVSLHSENKSLVAFSVVFLKILDIISSNGGQLVLMLPPR